MKRNDILTLTIHSVHFHKEERMMQGAVYGNYTSNYVATFKEYPNGIVVVDSLAAATHPDWEKKTENRANTLSSEFAGRKVTVRVTDVFAGKDTFEATLL